MLVSRNQLPVLVSVEHHCYSIVNYLCTIVCSIWRAIFFCRPLQLGGSDLLASLSTVRPAFCRPLVHHRCERCGIQILRCWCHVISYPCWFLLSTIATRSLTTLAPLFAPFGEQFSFAVRCNSEVLTSWRPSARYDLEVCRGKVSTLTTCQGKRKV